MERRGTNDRIQCQDGVVMAVQSIEHTYGMPTTTGDPPARSIAYPSHV